MAEHEPELPTPNLKPSSDCQANINRLLWVVTNPTSSKTSIQWCNACCRLLPKEVKLCPHCGAPTGWRIFAFLYVYRYFITIGLTLITAVMFYLSLSDTQQQLKQQRKLWDFEHTPRLVTAITSLTHTKNKIGIRINTLNNGDFDASSVESFILLLNDVGDTLNRLPDNGFDSLGTIEGKVSLSRNFETFDSDAILKKNLWIIYQLRYRWVGSDTILNKVSFFRATFDTLNNAYSYTRTTQDKMPK